MEDILKELSERLITAYQNNVSCTIDLHRDSSGKQIADVNFSFSVGGYVPESRTMTTTFKPDTSVKIKEQRLARIDKFLKETSETTICY